MNKKILLFCSVFSIAVASDHHQDENISIGIYTDRGQRAQEDRYYIGKKLFVVCDGHGGSAAAAEYAVNYFPQAVAKYWKTSATKKEAFENAVKDIEIEMFKVKKMKYAGSTLVAAYIGKRKIRFAWVGDSRAMSGSKQGIIAATQDHTLQLACEKERVMQAGGIIYRRALEGGERGQLRINGSVPTRKIAGYVAKGMFPNAVMKMSSKATYEQYKRDSSTFAIVPGKEFVIHPQKGQIIADPDYIEIERNEKSRFVVLATDGLWDVMTNEDVMKFVVELANEGRSTKEIARILTTIAIRRGSEDNITTLVLDLNPWG